MNFRNSFSQSSRFNNSKNCGGSFNERPRSKNNFAAYNQSKGFGGSVGQEQRLRDVSNNFSVPYSNNFCNNSIGAPSRSSLFGDQYAQRSGRGQQHLGFAGGGNPAIYNQQAVDYNRGSKQYSRNYNNHYVIPDRATRRAFYNDPVLDGPEVDYYNYDSQRLPSEARAVRRGDARRANRTRFFANIASRSGRDQEEEYEDRRAAPEPRSRRRVEDERRRPRDFSRDIEDDLYYEDEDNYSDEGYEEERQPSRRKKLAKRPEYREEEYDDYEDYGDECEDEEDQEYSKSSRRKNPSRRLVCREEEYDDEEEAPKQKSSAINFFKKKKRQ